jgi:hypothetical protein
MDNNVFIALALIAEIKANATPRTDWEADFVRLQQRADSEAALRRVGSALTLPIRYVRRLSRNWLRTTPARLR